MLKINRAWQAIGAVIGVVAFAMNCPSRGQVEDVDQQHPGCFEQPGSSNQTPGVSESGSVISLSVEFTPSIPFA